MLFRKRQPTIDSHFEHTARTFNQFDLRIRYYAAQNIPHTEGLVFVASHNAVFDFDFHTVCLRNSSIKFT